MRRMAEITGSSVHQTSRQHHVDRFQSSHQHENAGAIDGGPIVLQNPIDITTTDHPRISARQRIVYKIRIPLSAQLPHALPKHTDALPRHQRDPSIHLVSPLQRHPTLLLSLSFPFSPLAHVTRRSPCCKTRYQRGGDIYPEKRSATELFLFQRSSWHSKTNRRLAATAYRSRQQLPKPCKSRISGFERRSARIAVSKEPGQWQHFRPSDIVAHSSFLT